jgi:hypothetical protein
MTVIVCLRAVSVKKAKTPHTDVARHSETETEAAAILQISDGDRAVELEDI